MGVIHPDLVKGALMADGKPRLCGYFDGGDQCDARTERRYLPGWRCPRHTPAALAGRPEDTPDPDRTAEGLARGRRPDGRRHRYGDDAG